MLKIILVRGVMSDDETLISVLRLRASEARSSLEGTQYHTVRCLQGSLGCATGKLSFDTGATLVIGRRPGSPEWSNVLLIVPIAYTLIIDSDIDGITVTEIIERTRCSNCGATLLRINGVISNGGFRIFNGR